MNAYELAKLLDFDAETLNWKAFKDAANMLRQQANRIAELEKINDFLNEGWSEDQDRTAELEKEVQNLKAGLLSHNSIYPPQTKPLSFDVIVELGKEVDAVWDVNINGSVWFPSVDAFESFCRAIEAKVRGQ